MSRYFLAGIITGIVISLAAGWYSMNRIFNYANRISHPEKVYKLSSDATLYQDGVVIGKLFKGARLDYAGEIDKVSRLNLPIGFESYIFPENSIQLVEGKEYSFVEMTVPTVLDSPSSHDSDERENPK